MCHWGRHSTRRRFVLVQGEGSRCTGDLPTSDFAVSSVPLHSFHQPHIRPSFIKSAPPTLIVSFLSYARSIHVQRREKEFHKLTGQIIPSFIRPLTFDNTLNVLKKKLFWNYERVMYLGGPSREGKMRGRKKRERRADWNY